TVTNPLRTYDAATSPTGSAAPAQAGYIALSDGANLQGHKAASAANLAASISSGAALGEKGPRWRVVSAPAVSVRASASKAAGAAGVRHLTDCVFFALSATTAPTATMLSAQLRDGATGAGTVIWQMNVVAGGAGAATHGAWGFCGLNLVGSPAT